MSATTSTPTASISWLPTTIDRRVRVMAWLSLIAQSLLIATGGLVRLTGSGLGCPTWPLCTSDSLVNTPEMGIHGIIEFGNRTLTFVLVIIAVLAFAFVWNLRRERRDLFWLTFWQGMSIPLQAGIGGITVLTGLNSYIVGVHFVISILLVALTTVLVYRVYNGPVAGLRVIGIYRVVTWTLAVLVGITVLVGILVTGAGPHAGDADTPRNGLDLTIIQHIHSWPGYAMLLMTLIALPLAFQMGYPKKALLWLLVAEICQITLGITQARLGVPAFLVAGHMVLAAVVVALATCVVLSTYASRDSRR